MNSHQPYPCVRLWRLWTLLIVCVCPPLVLGQATRTPGDLASANDLRLANLPKTEAARNAWRDRTRLSSDNNRDAESKKKLQETLKQLKSLRFTDEAESELLTTTRAAAEPDTDTAPQRAVNKPVIIIRTQPPKATPEFPNNVPPSNATLTKQTAEALHLLAQSPEKLPKPELLGQILLRSKAYAEAALCYQESLKRLNAKSVAPSEDKAWLLLQIGNCLQQTDPKKATTIYKQLISEYPHSLWSELVRVKTQWIIWELRDKPKTLINDIKANKSQEGKK
jgi:tetratricopeptide (TPR) repeat protein